MLTKRVIEYSQQLFRNSPELQTTIIFINRRMGERIVTQPYNGTQYSSEKEQRTNRSENTDKSHKHYVEEKKPEGKSPYCAIPCIRNSRKCQSNPKQQKVD